MKHKKPKHLTPTRIRKQKAKAIAFRELGEQLRRTPRRFGFFPHRTQNYQGWDPSLPTYLNLLAALLPPSIPFKAAWDHVQGWRTAPKSIWPNVSIGETYRIRLSWVSPRDSEFIAGEACFGKLVFPRGRTPLFLVWPDTNRDGYLIRVEQPWRSLREIKAAVVPFIQGVMPQVLSCYPVENGDYPNVPPEALQLYAAAIGMLPFRDRVRRGESVPALSRDFYTIKHRSAFSHINVEGLGAIDALAEYYEHDRAQPSGSDETVSALAASLLPESKRLLAFNTRHGLIPLPPGVVVMPFEGDLFITIEPLSYRIPWGMLSLASSISWYDSDEYTLKKAGTEGGCLLLTRPTLKYRGVLYGTLVPAKLFYRNVDNILSFLWGMAVNVLPREEDFVAIEKINRGAKAVCVPIKPITSLSGEGRQKKLHHPAVFGSAIAGIRQDLSAMRITTIDDRGNFFNLGGSVYEVEKLPATTPAETTEEAPQDEVATQINAVLAQFQTPPVPPTGHLVEPGSTNPAAPAPLGWSPWIAPLPFHAAPGDTAAEITLEHTAQPEEAWAEEPGEEEPGELATDYDWMDGVDDDNF